MHDHRKKCEAREKLERIYNALADDICAMSDEDLVAELREDGEDIHAIAVHTRKIIMEAIADFDRQKQKQMGASDSSDSQADIRERKVLQWPAEKKRALIDRLIRENETGGGDITLAARKGEAADENLDSFIESLIELDIIDDEGNLK